MTLDEAIKHAEEKAKELKARAKPYEEAPCTIVNKMYAKNCQECAEEHEQLAEWLKELKALRGEWISVSERLPEIATSCLVQLSNGYITIGKYHSIRGGCWVFIDTTIQFVYPKDSVITWQPLPEPYKKGGAE